MSNKTFHHIMLIGRAGVNGVPETLQALSEYLKSHKISVCIEESTAPLIQDSSLPVITPDQIPQELDLIIVVGGDGSLLSAAHIAVAHDLPVLGINRGRLGFLTDIHPDHIDKIGNVLNGNYQQEQRFLLDCDLYQQKKCISHAVALNDVVLMPGDVAHMIEFDVSINKQFVCNQRADGMIIASPTGSTAYALSGGGPILHPQLDAVVIVPMFPHTLSSRPIVIDANNEIELFICNTNENSLYVSCDGLERMPIAPGGTIHIKKKTEKLKLIHPIDYDYYTTLREKLGWERHARRS